MRKANHNVVVNAAVCLVCSWFLYGDAARILLVPPQLASHVIVQESLGEELSRRGHDVSIALGSRYPKPDSILASGMKIISYHIPQDVPYGFSSQMERQFVGDVFNPPKDVLVKYASTVSGMLNRDCDLMMSDKEFMERVKASNFDLMIIEVFPISACGLILPVNLSIPFVVLSGAYFPWDIGLAALPSFYVLPAPKFASLGSIDVHTFFGRLFNTASYLFRRFKLAPQMWGNMSLLERFAGPDVTTWQDAQRQAQLFLFDNDHHLDFPMPSMPNVIDVASVTLKPVKPLPGSLENIFTEARDNGVILLSFGSAAYHMPDDITIKFLNVFARLQQTVIARLPAPHGVVIPRNVKLLSWLPQNDILGRNKTRLFITHCGRNGQYEALFNGVPMLGFPLFAEQSWNSYRMQRKGFGREMEIRNFSESELYDNIRELLDNSTYTDAIRKMSSIFRDQPMIGREKAAFWIEHVIKYGGLHLRSPASNMPMYQFLMLDVMVVFLTTLLIFISICVCVMKRSIANCSHQLSKSKLD